MKPIFNPFARKKDIFKKDILLTNCLSIKISNSIQKDKFIIINHPFKENTKVVRYLVGVPGDWIREKNSQMYHKIPDGYCWVESFIGEDDSNTWGPVIIKLK